MAHRQGDANTPAQPGSNPDPNQNPGGAPERIRGIGDDSPDIAEDTDEFEDGDELDDDDADE